MYHAADTLKTLRTMQHFTFSAQFGSISLKKVCRFCFNYLINRDKGRDKRAEIKACRVKYKDQRFIVNKSDSFIFRFYISRDLLENLHCLHV